METTTLIVSLVEIQMGIITASMPSLAGMMRHHLPPWEMIRARLPHRHFGLGNGGSSRIYFRLFGRAQSIQPNSGKPKTSESSGMTLRYEGQRKPGPKGSSLLPSFELGSLSSVKTFIYSGRHNYVDEDGIHLKHNVEHS